MDYKPVIEEIVKDEVEFYAHTILKFGIVFNVWYKVGTSKNIGEGYKDALFGDADEYMCLSPHETIKVNPIENWTVWRINEPPILHGRLKKEYMDKLNRGGVISYVDIINRLECGYFKYKRAGWKIEDGKNVPIIEYNRPYGRRMGGGYHRLPRRGKGGLNLRNGLRFHPQHGQRALRRRPNRRRFGKRPHGSRHGRSHGRTRWRNQRRHQRLHAGTELLDGGQTGTDQPRTDSASCRYGL